MAVIALMTQTKEVNTISVLRANKLHLMEIGKKGQSFDDILSNVLEKMSKDQSSIQGSFV